MKPKRILPEAGLLHAMQVGEVNPIWTSSIMRRQCKSFLLPTVKHNIFDSAADLEKLSVRALDAQSIEDLLK
jgi:hypothetical protein